MLLFAAKNTWFRILAFILRTVLQTKTKMQLELGLGIFIIKCLKKTVLFYIYYYIFIVPSH